MNEIENNNPKYDYIASSTDSDTNMINNEIKFKSTPGVGIITPIPTYGTIKNPLDNSTESNSDNSNEIKTINNYTNSINNNNNSNNNTNNNNNKNILTPQTSVELSYKSDMDNTSNQYIPLNNNINNNITNPLQSNTISNNNNINNNYNNPISLNFKQPLHIPSLYGKSAFTVVSEDEKSLSSYNQPMIIKDGLSTRATYIPSISSQGGSITGCEDMRELIPNDINNSKNNIDSNLLIQQLKQCTEETKRENERLKLKLQPNVLFILSLLYYY